MLTHDVNHTGQTRYIWCLFLIKISKLPIVSSMVSASRADKAVTEDNTVEPGFNAHYSHEMLPLLPTIKTVIKENNQKRCRRIMFDFLLHAFGTSGASIVPDQ